MRTDQQWELRAKVKHKEKAHEMPKTIRREKIDCTRWITKKANVR